MPGVLVLDFDGTVTLADVGDAVCERFADPSWRAIDDQWVRNEISLPEAQRRMWALARATREEAAEFLRGEAGGPPPRRAAGPRGAPGRARGGGGGAGG